MTHQHTSDHMDDDAASPNPAVRRMVLATLAPLVVATIIGLIVLWPSSPEVDSFYGGERVNATVVDVQPCADTDAPECREAAVRIDNGPDADAEVIVPLPYGEAAPDVGLGDKIVVRGVADQPLEQRYDFVDFQRSIPLLALAVVFALAVVALSRWRGLAALGGLAISVLVLTVFVLPALLNGESPLAVAVVGASAIMICTLYLSHGVSIKTSVALLGTLVSLTLTGLLGSVAIAAAQFTGLADDSAVYLGAMASQIDLRGLLLAGLVIGALGVLDDVTVTQASAVWELAAADSGMRRGQLFAAALRIGRDHVAATVNTLVLAYAGAALPLLLLFVAAAQGFTDVVTTEVVAQEVVRALAGSLGIIAAVPVTTALAVVAVRTRQRPRGRRVRRPARS
jgi:uncharacterized membrane protein